MFSLPPLLTLGWTSLPMLGWLAVAAAPILIHLWSRRRYRETSWAAMEWLLAAMRQQARRIRFEQWLLVAIRTLLVVLVVLAVAGPFLESGGFALALGGRVHRVLVFDGSYSMAYKRGEKSRFDRAKELARRLVDESAEGDAFTLVLMSSSPTVVAQSITRQSATLREIDDLRLPDAGADLRAAVRAVRQAVEIAGRENPRLVRHEVYFLTDVQRATWAPQLSEAARAQFRRQTGELAKAASLAVIDVGDAATENLAVTSLEVADWPVTVGRDAAFSARLQNFGRRNRERQAVELLVDGRRIERKQVTVPAEGAASMAFNYRFDVAGEHRVEVRATGDSLEIDNRRYLAVRVREAVRVLCIDGRPGGGTFRGAADYLAVALSPRVGEGRTGDRTPIRVDVAAEGAILDRKLSNYDCVFLCNVAQLTAAEIRAIDAYLQAGGNVVFWLGDQVMADRYNREVGQVDNRPPQLLPARIGPLVDRSEYRLDPLGYRHPIVKAFQGRGETSLLTTPVFKHYKLAPAAGALTVLALASGDPLVVEQPVHRGRVIVVGTSAESAWTAMPLWPSFVPLVQEMVGYCLSDQVRRRNVRVDESIEFPMRFDTGSLQVQSPDGRLHRIATGPTGEQATYADTSESGFYVVRTGSALDRGSVFAVNVDTAESDLGQIDLEELRGKVWAGVPFICRTASQDVGLVALAAASASGGRLHVGLLYAVLGLLFVETWLGWKMGYHRQETGLTNH